VTLSGWTVTSLRFPATGREPRRAGNEVARLKLKGMGTTIDTLTPAQVKYMATWSEGT